MTPVVVARRPRGKGLRSKAAKRRKHDLSHHQHVPKTTRPTKELT